VPAPVIAGKWSCTPPQGDGDNTVTFTIFDKAGGKASASPVVVHKRSKVVFVRKNKTGDGTSWANAKGELSDVLKSGFTLPTDAEVWVGMGSYGKGNGYTFTSNTAIIGAFSNTGAPLKTDANPALFVTSMDPIDMWIGSFEEPVSNFKIYGMVFDGSTALSRVYITKSTGITLESCKFTKFHADIPLLIRNESNVKIINSTFSNSYGVSEGMISVWTGSFVDIQNCEIKDNSTTSGGGGLYILEASVQLTNCTFSGNTVEASDDNGEPISKPMNIYVSDAGNLSHTGLKLSGGSATVSGGGTFTPPIP
jgi:hypothetical protein